LSVIAISQRGYPPPSKPFRPVLGRRRPTSGGPPAILTITLDITLGGGDPLTPQASRLLALVHELVEQGDPMVVAASPEHVSVSIAPSPAVPAESARVDQVDPVQILAASRVVLHDGQPVALTRLEYDLLVFLAEHPRRVFTRLQLLSNVWGYEHGVARTVDVHVRRLRAKVGETVPLVTTVYGVGYRLTDDARVSIDHDA
jgi:DNA-binding response OmpR family regulator